MRLQSDAKLKPSQQRMLTLCAHVPVSTLSLHRITPRAACRVAKPRQLVRGLTVSAESRNTGMLLEEKKELVANSIRGVPDFPKKGILFWDITTLCLDPKAFRCCIDAFEERYKDQKIDVVAGEMHELLCMLSCLSILYHGDDMLQDLKPGGSFLVPR